MARNKIQFQKGMSLAAFLEKYGAEAQCATALYTWRWTEGFKCPQCGHDKSCQAALRNMHPCNRCHHQNLAEFQYRLIAEPTYVRCSYDPSIYIALRTPPMPEKLLKLGLVLSGY